MSDVITTEDVFDDQELHALITMAVRMACGYPSLEHMSAVMHTLIKKWDHIGQETKDVIKQDLLWRIQHHSEMVEKEVAKGTDTMKIKTKLGDYWSSDSWCRFYKWISSESGTQNP